MAAQLNMAKIYSDMRRYCMADVCAGMSIGELSALPRAALTLDRPLIEDKLCNSRQQQNINGTFVGQDGTSFDVAFYLFPGSGSAKDVYRVVLVNLRLENLAPQDLDQLTKTLTDRYRMKESDGIWYDRRFPLMDVSVSARQFFQPNESVSQLKLSVAPVGALAYTLNEPWCLGDPIPQLPPPRSALPVL